MSVQTEFYTKFQKENPYLTVYNEFLQNLDSNLDKNDINFDLDEKFKQLSNHIAWAQNLLSLQFLQITQTMAQLSCENKTLKLQVTSLEQNSKKQFQNQEDTQKKIQKTEQINTSTDFSYNNNNNQNSTQMFQKQYDNINQSQKIMQEDYYKQDNYYQTQEHSSKINESKLTNKYKFDCIQKQQNLQDGQQQTNKDQVNQFQVQNQSKYMEIENENKNNDYQMQTKNQCKQSPSFNKNIGDLQEISPKNTQSEEDQDEKQNNQQKQQNFYFSQNKIGAVNGKKFKKKNNIDYKQFQIQENNFNSESEDYNNNENSDQNKSQNSGSNSKKKPQIQIQQKIGEQRVYNFKTKKNFQFSQSQSNIEINSQNPDDQFIPEQLGMSENCGKSTLKNVNNKIDLNDLEDFKYKNNAKKKKTNNNIFSVDQQRFAKNADIDNEINDNDNLYTKASISDETKNLNLNQRKLIQNQQQEHIEDQIYIQNNYDSDNNVIPRQKVLNKQKRLQLNGYSCPDCEKFYKTFDPDGKFQLQNNCSKHRDIRPPLIQKINNSDDLFSQ